MRVNSPLLRIEEVPVSVGLESSAFSTSWHKKKRKYYISYNSNIIVKLKEYAIHLQALLHCLYVGPIDLLRTVSTLAIPVVRCLD